MYEFSVCGLDPVSGLCDYNKVKNKMAEAATRLLYATNYLRIGVK